MQDFFMQNIFPFISDYYLPLEPYISPYLPLIITLFKILVFVIPLLTCVAYLTYAERKLIAAMQLRKGPNVVGPFGLLQPVMDGLKCFLKEIVIPTRANKWLFLGAPILTFTVALIAWAVIPVNEGWVIADINVGVLYILAISSLSVYGVIVAGWSANSRYAFLGALRAAAQMISYEVSIGLIVVSIVLSSGTMNLTEIVKSQENLWYLVPHFPLFIMFIVSMLAETNRTPFDIPEAESELVAGFFVEYSGLAFSYFFLGEYANMILMSSLATILFLGGWLAPFGMTFIPAFIWFVIKVCCCLFIFIWVRTTVPRYRFDQLMRLGWKVFLPIALTWAVLTAFYVKFSLV
jgi:NADH-quinone oxidoreductase subunit H